MLKKAGGAPFLESLIYEQLATERWIHPTQTEESPLGAKFYWLRLAAIQETQTLLK